MCFDITIGQCTGDENENKEFRIGLFGRSWHMLSKQRWSGTYQLWNVISSLLTSWVTSTAADAIVLIGLITCQLTNSITHRSSVGMVNTLIRHIYIGYSLMLLLPLYIVASVRPSLTPRRFHTHTFTQIKWITFNIGIHAPAHEGERETRVFYN